MGKKEAKRKDQFGSKFGIIAAAAGSAVGLGNIWKFPYITGNNGGAAFLIVYLFFIFLIGFPIMTSEFIIGRKTGRNVHGAFERLAPGKTWGKFGYLGIFAAFTILSFYCVVAGWSIEYLINSLSNSFWELTPQQYSDLFDSLVVSGIKPVIYLVIFMSLTALIVMAGVKDGIEKYAKILMPFLLLIIIILDIRAITLPGASKGLEFFFRPDFSKLNAHAVLEALGHAFFSLSLGMGVLITYGAYVGKKENLSTTALQVTIADTVIAILAGVAIFPAVFAFDLNPGAGPGLVYKTLPIVFQQMPAGHFFGFMFFLLLLIAALTSSISLLEVVVAYFVDELKMVRKNATIMAAALITILSILCSLSLGSVKINLFGLSFFDLLDKISSNFALPIGGFSIAIFAGWYLKRKSVKQELTNNNTLQVKWFGIFMFLVKWLAPFGIGVVFLYKLGLFNLFK
ncbi:sodium-dependent transporter [Bacteroidales bacterium]|nr:sodium-dependent transporter [Bacteroidales bacterium]